MHHLRRWTPRLSLAVQLIGIDLRTIALQRTNEGASRSCFAISYCAEESVYGGLYGGLEYAAKRREAKPSAIQLLVLGAYLGVVAVESGRQDDDGNRGR